MGADNRFLTGLSDRFGMTDNLADRLSEFQPLELNAVGLDLRQIVVGLLGKPGGRATPENLG